MLEDYRNALAMLNVEKTFIDGAENLNKKRPENQTNFQQIKDKMSIFFENDTKMI